MATSFFNQLSSSFKRYDMVMKLIIINVIVFSVISLINVFYKIGVDVNAATPIDLYVIKYLTLPSSLSDYILQPWSIITYMFWHINIGHIFWNMVMFYFFGSIFQEYLGSKRLVNVYLWGGIVGGLLFLTLVNLLPGLSKISAGLGLAGASAGVMAVLVAAATLLPRYEISIFGIFSIRLPFIALFMALLSVLGMAGINAGGEIAHVGGALFGFFYIKAIYSNFTWFTNLKKKFTAPPKKKEYKPNMKVYEPSKNYYIHPNGKRKPSQEEIDMILDKISESGYESLNQSEKEILFKASNPDK